MAWHEAFMERLSGYRMPEWEQIPDLGLYMDQVITFLSKLYAPLFGGDRRIITPAMINNYVKSELIHRPHKKKYDRDLLAQLIIVCLLKTVVPLEDLGSLLAPDTGEDTEQIYRSFLHEQRAASDEFTKMLPEMSAMRSAVQGATYALLTAEILHDAE